MSCNCRPNIWPQEDLPELETAFKELGRLIIKTGLLVARACDQYVLKRNKEFQAGRLEQVLSRSVNPKGRLLHYYPPSEDGPSANWCAQHTDHGSLTGKVIISSIFHATCIWGLYLLRMMAYLH